MAEESNLQVANTNDEERLSDDWTEDWTDDDYCSVISSDCSISAPPFSPIADDSDNEVTCVNSTCDEFCEFDYNNHTSVYELYIISGFKLTGYAVIQLTSI